MEIKEFLENFANQFDDTDTSVFVPETKFREVEEWSSLTALSIISMIDEEYDVTVKGNELANVSTIRQLFDLVSSKI